MLMRLNIPLGLLLLFLTQRPLSAMENSLRRGTIEIFQKQMAELDKSLRQYLSSLSCSHDAQPKTCIIIEKILSNPFELAIMTAVRKGCVDVVDMIFSFIKNIHGLITPAQLLHALFKYDYGEYDGYASLLFIAAAEGHDELVSFLLTQDARRERGMFKVPKMPTWELASRLDDILVLIDENEYKLVPSATPLHAAQAHSFQRIIKLLEPEPLGQTLVLTQTLKTVPPITYSALTEGQRAVLFSKK